MQVSRFKTLQNRQTQISDGDYIVVNDMRTLSVQISGTSTNFKVDFCASLDNETYCLYEGNQSKDMTLLNNSTTANGEMWEFDVSSVLYFKAKITSIAHGYVTICATAIDD